jgi:GntR family transcriptional regulator, transcriptional repressor for pyruvate dehydrogenase complex
MGGALPDPDRYAALDLQFHMTIARSSQNGLLSAFTDALRHAAIATMTAGGKIATPDEWAEIQRCHENLVAAITAGDAAGARNAMLEHFKSALQRLDRASAVVTAT